MELSFREEGNFQNALMQSPRAGDVIVGTGGAKKVRWADERRGMGKRGGIRVVYLYVETCETTLFLAAYDKNIEDLTSMQKKEIAEAVKAFKIELEAGT